MTSDLTVKINVDADALVREFARLGVEMAKAQEAIARAAVAAGALGAAFTGLLGRKLELCRHMQALIRHQAPTVVLACPPPPPLPRRGISLEGI